MIDALTYCTVRRTVNTNRASKHSNPFDEICELLDRKAVLIANWRNGKKGMPGWNKRTLADMEDPAYRNTFIGKNIGVRLGKASGGLCSIDWDGDELLRAFLGLNPKLRETLITKRVRGGNVWVWIDGVYPPFKELKDTNGAHLGEWRCDGHQTIIHGAAIDRKKGETDPTKYSYINKAKPVRVRFREIVWPDGVCFDKRKELNTHKQHPPSSISCISESCISLSTISQRKRSKDVVASIKAKANALKRLGKKHPHLAKLYTQILEPRLMAMQGRNAFIKESVPFLYRCVSAPLVLELSALFFDCNRWRFTDSRETHVKETARMLHGVSKRYSRTLTAGEREVYKVLTDEREQDTFRICRDLALLKSQDTPFQFPMSCNALGDRIGLYPQQAQRILQQFDGYGLIHMVSKGRRWVPGAKPKASVYEWLLK